MTESGSDDLGAGHAQQRDSDIAQRRHDLSSGAPADAASVLVEGDVTDPMEAVFNRPMGAAECENALRVGALCGHAGNSVDGFGAEFLRDDFCGVALDGEHLSAMRKVAVALQFGTGPDLAHFDAAMAFICCDVLRGEKTPVLMRRYLGAKWADYL